MSLSGSIEDLPLLEILQVVAFCQKTGHLTVRAREGDAGVLFSGGRVVAGYIWETPLPCLPPQGASDRSGQLRARIAAILERLVRLREGRFAFNLTDEVPSRLGDRDLSDETLPDGLNPEELMLDLARKLDEDRRDGAATIEATFSAPVADDAALEEAPAAQAPSAEPMVEAPPAAPPAQAERPPSILLVDDEPEVCRVVGRQLANAGFDVVTAASAGHARREMARLSADGKRLLLVVDLGLPSRSGTSFRGGLDVVREATGLAAPPPVLLMTETINERLRARAKRLGVSTIAFKPGLSKLDPRQYEADLKAFAGKLARDLLPRLAGRSASAAPSLPRTQAPTPAVSAIASDPATRAAALESALKQIEAGCDADLVSLQLLRAAHAFFPRAILFVIKDDALRGVSGFGPTGAGGRLDLLARDLVVPLKAPSPFADVVATGRAWSGAVPGAGPMRELLERVGETETSRAAVVPIRVGHHTVALLFADLPDGPPASTLDPFVAFVAEAGLRLEAALAARRAAPPAQPTTAAC